MRVRSRGKYENDLMRANNKQRPHADIMALMAKSKRSTRGAYIVWSTCCLLSLWQLRWRNLPSSPIRKDGTRQLFEPPHHYLPKHPPPTTDVVVVASPPPISLNLLAPTVRPQCVTVRFRGDDTKSYSVDEALLFLSQEPVPRPSWGFLFLEEIDQFFPLRVRPTGNQYHMFHFMELLIIAYSQWQRFSSSQKEGFTVNWIFSPYMSPSEICGGANVINCLIADIVLSRSNYSIFQNHTGVFGLEDMEHVPFDPQHPKDKRLERRRELFTRVYGGGEGRESSPLPGAQALDAVLIVQRSGCSNYGINKPWYPYIDTFPAARWHADILESLGRSDAPVQRNKLVVGYIDRQNTVRQLLDVHHKWILQYVGNHQKIDFRHLHMEDYSPLQQIEVASECDVIMGVHGNGLTHSLWMPPQRFVIEFFWDFSFQFDYATTAQLMKHTYLGLWNGRVIDPERVRKRDPSLRQDLKRLKPTKGSMDAFEREGRVAIEDTIERAIVELNIL